jgi:hypothetical protein
MTYAGTTYTRPTKPTDLYDLLQELIDENPKADRAKLKRLGVAEVKRDPDNVDAAVEGFVEHAFNVLLRAKPGPDPKKRKRVTREEKERKNYQYMRQNIHNWSMPNGKKLKDCTFGQVLSFQEDLGRLGHMGKPDEIVGQVLTPKQIKDAVYGKRKAT